ncbi:outer membrane beta-barrel protein [Kiritimatiellaeota bacterium B1221]|nr:outer membrane beta-barrel protein [Kiritimatiellaeota bacterium B1221]
MKIIYKSHLFIFGWIWVVLPLQAQMNEKAPVRDRIGSWEFSIPLIYAFDATIDGDGGSRVDLDDDIGFGFAAAYNVSNQLSFGGFFNWSYRGYEAKGPKDDGGDYRYTNSLETTALGGSATYFILEGPATPFITGSLGYTFMDTNIQNGPSDVYCYYDPWWGYICNGYVPTRTEDGFSYSLGIGFRFDVSDSVSLQLSYNKSWVELDNTSGTPDFDTIRLDFIFRSF